MQITKTDSCLKDAVEISTEGRAIRATVEHPANEVSLACSGRLKQLEVGFALTDLGEDERGTILKCRREIGAVDMQAVRGTLAVRVEAERTGSAIGLSETLEQVSGKIDPP